MATAPHISFYVDGFNLYYRASKPNSITRWLDLDALARALRPGAVIRIRYFTARRCRQSAGWRRPLDEITLAAG